MNPTVQSVRSDGTIFQYFIHNRHEIYSRKFMQRAINAVVDIHIEHPHNVVSLSDVIFSIQKGFDLLIEEVLGEVAEQDRIRVSLSTAALEMPITIPFMKRSEFTLEALRTEILKVNQSKREFLAAGQLNLEIVHVKIPTGSGRSHYDQYLDLDAFKESKRFLKVRGDGLCCPRAIILGKAYSDGARKYQWRRWKEDIKGIQTRAAIDLCQAAGIEPYTPCGIDQLQQFQAALPDYQIIVFTPVLKTTIFHGSHQEKKIFLLYDNQHFDTILSVQLFLGVDYFCGHCLKSGSNAETHSCSGVCQRCETSPPCLMESLQTCRNCRRVFNNAECFSNHLKRKGKRKPICNLIKNCPKCSRVMRGKSHTCYEYFCKKCGIKTDMVSHQCFITPLDMEKISKEDSKVKVFIFYDMESKLEPGNNQSYSHDPSLILARLTCDLCWNSETKSRNEGKCELCGDEMKEFTSVKDFCSFIFTAHQKSIESNRKRLNLPYRPLTFCIAHNGKAYDSIFILRYLLSTRRTPKVMKRGTRIISMKLGKIRFICSLSFLPMPLRKLPKSFGVQEQMTKGHFPYRFYNQENEHYIGPWPSIEWYDLDYLKMSQSEQQEFRQWHQSKSNETFDLQKELRLYCLEDVKILQKCFLIFRDLFKQTCGIDPITNIFTLPQASMQVFRAKFLKPETIAVIPSSGYVDKRNSSYEAEVWLNVLERKNNIIIQREVYIKPYYVDGMNAQTNTVYEFEGCFWHVSYCNLL